MEVGEIANNLKYVNFNGVTLHVEERINLQLALQKLNSDFKFDELLFWGKIQGKRALLLSKWRLTTAGTVKDYYVA